MERESVTIGKAAVLLAAAAVVGILAGCSDIGQLLEQELTAHPQIVVKVGGMAFDAGVRQDFPDTVQNQTAVLSFEIVNSGSDDLDLLGSGGPVALQGSGCFSIELQPASTVPAQGSRSFNITFTPVALVTYTGTVTMECNDPNTPSFSFAIQGRGVAEAPPAAPGGVQASDGSSTSNIVVSWDAVSGADLYYVYRSATATPPAGELTIVLSTSHTDTTCTPGVLYYYWVKSYDEQKTTAHFSDYSGSATGYRRLSVPSIVSATDGTSTSSITVMWNTTTGADTYELYRSTSATAPTDGTAASTTGLTGTSTDDTGVGAASKYNYWVRARASSSGSCSAWSATSTDGYLKLSPPQNLLATSENWAVGLSWTASAGATHYFLYRSVLSPVTTADEYMEQVGEPANPTTGTTYMNYSNIYGDGPFYYSVRAYSSVTGSWSDFSDEVLQIPGYYG